MIYTKTYGDLPINKKEILRYAGVTSSVPEIEAVVDECIGNAHGNITARVCYGEFKIAQNGEYTDLGFITVRSEALAKNLKGCSRIILFAATVGIGIDRLILRNSSLSPIKALIFQAIGAERIETLCDTFCAETERELGEDYTLRPRFSPGYGDLPLEIQRDIFSVLDVPRKIGLTLNESLLMSPTKSVTAIVGIGKKDTKPCEVTNI